MSEYVKYALAVRKKVSKLTLEQQKEILNLYEDTISNLASKAASAKDKSLTKRWVLDYQKELTKAKNELAKKINASVKVSINKAAKLGTEAEQLIMNQIFDVAGIDPGDHL